MLESQGHRAPGSVLTAVDWTLTCTEDMMASQHDSPLATKPTRVISTQSQGVWPQKPARHSVPQESCKTQEGQKPPPQKTNYQLSHDSGNY